MSKIKEKLNKFPMTPGVYTFLDDKKKILYIGKATNLKSRVGSYFSLTPNPSPKGRGGIFSRPIEAMIHKVADIQIQETDSVLEALILESNLIKKFQPKYNVERKDDKSFSYVTISQETYPRIEIVRESDLNKISNFQFPISNKIPNPKSQKLPTTNCQLQTIFGPYISKKQLEIALKIIRKIFPYHSNKQKTEKGCLDFQLGRCPGPYASAISKEDYAKNIRGIKMILEGKKKNLIKNLEREMKNHSKENEFEKAAELRNKIFALKHIQDIALISEPESNLEAKSYKLKAKRIEAYDISNISGQYAVGSMVVFSNGEPDKSQYRKFKIKTIEGSNDVGMMAEVLFRRFRHNEWPKPDLILLDGGQGHVNMGAKILQELGLDIPMVGIAKGTNRKKFTVHSLRFINNKQTTNYPPRLAKTARRREAGQLPTTNFIKNIMDEAHRFAINYHKKLRKNNFI